MQVYLLHGYAGKPLGGFRAWLRDELEQRGHSVHAVFLPEPERPIVATWKQAVRESIPDPTADTCIVGHSLGGRLALLYAAALPKGSCIGRMVLVAPSLHSEVPSDPILRALFAPWRAENIDVERVRAVVDDVRVLLSDNDRVVPLDETRRIAGELGAHTVVCHERGHWGDDNTHTKVAPEILEAVLG